MLSREITFGVPLFYQIVRRFHVPHHISHRASGMKWVNLSTPNVPHGIKTSQLICNANQLTGFNMMGKTGSEWVKRKIMRAEQRHFSKSNSPPWDLLFQNSEVKLLWRSWDSESDKETIGQWKIFPVIYVSFYFRNGAIWNIFKFF